MWLTKEEKKKIKYKPLVEAVIVAEGQEIPITGVLQYNKFWKLINDIIREKWSLEDGALRGGDISEKLLKKICRVIRERIEDDIKKVCNLEARLEWELDENSYTR
jgi:hypothetical protein